MVIFVITIAPNSKYFFSKTGSSIFDVAAALAVVNLLPTIFFFFCIWALIFNRAALRRASPWLSLAVAVVLVLWMITAKFLLDGM